MAHHLERLWRAAGSPAPRGADGEIIAPAAAEAGTCAFTGASGAFLFNQGLSDNFTLLRLLPGASVSSACSRRSTRPQPALSAAAAWAARDLALRCAAWILEPARGGDVLEWWPYLRPAPERVEEHRATWGDRTADGWLTWLLRPRPAETLAAMPKTGIEHGGEMCLGRCGWPGVGWRSLSAESVVQYQRASRPLVKLQAKHVALFARPSQRRGVLLLQVDSDQVVEVDSVLWVAARELVESAASELVALGVPAPAVRRGLLQQHLGLRAPAAAHARLAALLRELDRLPRHAFWPIFCGGIHV